MKARKIIEGASYDPAQVKALGEAFDAAWEHVAPGVRDHPAAHEAARMKLANLILKLAHNGIMSDPDQLAAEVVKLMFEPATL